MTKRWLLAAILAGAVAAGCQRGATDPEEAAGPMADAGRTGSSPPSVVDADAVGATDRPSLRIQVLDGAQYDLASHRGKWVVVNFWATWCAPCREEMPELSALGAMREHIEVIGLAYEEIEPEAMRAFLEQYPVAYPIAIVDVYDPPADFDTPRGLPMTWLIAPDGRVARKFLGPVTARDIEMTISEAGGPSMDEAAGAP